MLYYTFLKHLVTTVLLLVEYGCRTFASLLNSILPEVNGIVSIQIRNILDVYHMDFLVLWIQHFLRVSSIRACHFCNLYTLGKGLPLQTRVPINKRGGGCWIYSGTRRASCRILCWIDRRSCGRSISWICKLESSKLERLRNFLII